MIMASKIMEILNQTRLSKREHGFYLHHEHCRFSSYFLQNAMSSLSHFGFLNYFGPQRFGLDDKEVNACDIGLAMLQGDMVGCCIENRQVRALRAQEASRILLSLFVQIMAILKSFRFDDENEYVYGI